MRFTVRFAGEDSLYDVIKKLAEESKRSVNSMILVLLQEGIKAYVDKDK